MHIILFPALLFFVPASMLAQPPASTNFYQNIKNYDVSRLWKADSIFIEGGPEKIPFPEPLGFIGDNFQRFYIHYTSVTKNKDWPYVYDVVGKTRVKNNICRFTGQIMIVKAVRYKEKETGFEQFENGTLTCLVTFYEDSTQNGSGVIKGKLVSDFYLDKKGKLQYDALMAVADGYSNNGCTATWTSYKTKKTKKCNWGDFRIPESNHLDTGAGEFCVADEYVKYGWESYRKAADPNNSAALAEEARAWWR
jgi:hypothetical protein